MSFFTTAEIETNYKGMYSPNRWIIKSLKARVSHSKSFQEDLKPEDLSTETETPRINQENPRLNLSSLPCELKTSSKFNPEQINLDTDSSPIENHDQELFSLMEKLQL